ncbi:MAG: hypothetical protein R3B47_11905 [Bacteroidia bacterium]
MVAIAVVMIVFDAGNLYECIFPLFKVGAERLKLDVLFLGLGRLLPVRWLYQGCCPALPPELGDQTISLAKHGFHLAGSMWPFMR